MSKYFFLILCSFGVLGCASVKENTNDEISKIQIVPFYGVDSVFVGKSTKRDVLKHIGKAKVERKWRPNSYPIELGEVVKIIKYPDLGLTFILDHNKGRRFAKKTVREIIIDSTSVIKTPKGNGIGSSHSQIITEFGQTKLSKGTFPTFKLTDLWYGKTNPVGIYVTMSFQRYAIVDSSAFRVESISIRY